MPKAPPASPRYPFALSEIVAEPESQSPPRENGAKVVWSLAWPVVALNVLQTVNALLDVGFIGHLNQESLTAYGAATPVNFTLFTLAISLAVGTTALVSRAFGAQQVEEFRMAAKQSVSIGIVVGVALGLLAMGLTGPLAGPLLPDSATASIPYFHRYLFVFAFSLPATVIIQTLAASLRGIGDTKSPMAISGIQILLHISLNYIFIFPEHHLAGGIVLPGFNLGLTGAALALTVSGWMAAVGYLAYSGRTPLTEVWKFVRPSWHWFVRLMRISLPAALMGMLRVLSFGVFQVILTKSAEGAIAVPAMRPGFAIESIMFMPPFAMSAAAAALVGQSLGMKRPDRAEHLGWVAGHMGAIITVCLSIPVFIFAPQIAGVLIEGKPEVVAETARLLRFLAVTEVGFAYAMVMLGAMQGAGDTVRPLWITVVSLWGVRVPLTWLLVHGWASMPIFGPMIGSGFGTTGAWIAMSFTQLLQGGLSILAFKQGKWKTTKV